MTDCIHLGYACGEYFCYIDKGRKYTLLGKTQAYSFPANLCKDCKFYEEED